MKLQEALTDEQMPPKIQTLYTSLEDIIEQLRENIADGSHLQQAARLSATALVRAVRPLVDETQQIAGHLLVLSGNETVRNVASEQVPQAMRQFNQVMIPWCDEVIKTAADFMREAQDNRVLIACPSVKSMAERTQKLHALVDVCFEECDDMERSWQLQVAQGVRFWVVYSVHPLIEMFDEGMKKLQDQSWCATPTGMTGLDPKAFPLQLQKTNMWLLEALLELLMKVDDACRSACQ